MFFKKKYMLLMFEKIIQIVKNKLFFWWLRGEKHQTKLKGQLLRYLAVTNISALLIGTISKNNGDFYCLNCPNFFRRKNKFKSHKRIC